MIATYAAECLRTVRNRQFFVFSPGIPLLSTRIAGALNRNGTPSGQQVLATELRPHGLARCLRLDDCGARRWGEDRGRAARPVGTGAAPHAAPTLAYFGTKVITGYTSRALTIACSTSPATARRGLGPRPVEMTGLLRWPDPVRRLWASLGHLCHCRRGGSDGRWLRRAFLALLGGVWGPSADRRDPRHRETLPSFWLVQASDVGLGASGWVGKGWLGSARSGLPVCGRLAMRAFARDTGRA